MPFRQVKSLRFYQFKSLDHPHLVQAIFTRRGGVSPDPWRSLNVGGTVGDDLARVVENRQRAFAAVDRELDSIHDVWQVHSTNVVVADKPRNGRDLVQADILLSDNPQVTLFMRFADCVPILFYDPKNNAVGLAHAGWLGTLRGIATVAVQAMAEVYGTRAQDLRVGIGPSIGPDHYSIGPEVVAQVHETFGGRADQHLQEIHGEVYFNLWTANYELLKDQGVGCIEIAELCTACHPEDWYSHRGEKGVTGRFGGLIALRE
jgi:YfiH family protein